MDTRGWKNKSRPSRENEGKHARTSHTPSEVESFEENHNTVMMVGESENRNPPPHSHLVVLDGDEGRSLTMLSAARQQLAVLRRAKEKFN